MEQEDIRRLVYRGYEVTNCDYKKSIPWDDEHRFALIKDILAFSNAGGGNIVVGVDESLSTPEQQRTGIEDNHRSTFETTAVNRDVNNHCDSKLDVDVIPWLDESEKKWYIILRVPSHGLVPKICTREKSLRGSLILRKAAVYYRNKNKECAEICELADIQELMRRCTLNQRHDLLSAIEKIMEGRTTSPRPARSREDMIALLDARCHNAKSMNKLVNNNYRYQAFLCAPCGPPSAITPDKAKTVLTNVSVDYGLGWPFVFCSDRLVCRPQYSQDRIYAVSTSPFDEADRFFYWEFMYDGTFYSKRLLMESLSNFPREFRPDWQCKIIGEGILTMGKLYDGLGMPMDTELQLAIRYSSYNINDKIFAGFSIDRYPLVPFNYTDAAVTHIVVSRLAECLSNAPRLASKITDDLLGLLGAPKRPSQDFLEQIVAKHLEDGQRIPS